MSTARRLFLHRFWKERGAEFKEYEVTGGLGLWPRRFESEPDAACALYDASACARLELIGADRTRFLQGLVTCDVAALEPGDGAYGFFLGNKGQILADAVVLCLEDRLWLELPPGLEEEMTAHLRKYVVADRVEVQALDEMIPLCLLGREAGALLAGELRVDDPPEHLFDPEPPAGALFCHTLADFSGTQLHVARDPRYGEPAWLLYISASIVSLVAEDLLALPGIGLRGFDAVEDQRIRAGLPRFGPDIAPGMLPQEVQMPGVSHLEAAIDYEKGCYLGQEVVARLHYRGQVNKQLRLLEFEPGTVLQSGEAVVQGDKSLGALKSAGSSRALALLKRAALEQPEGLTVNGVPVQIPVD